MNLTTEDERQFLTTGMTPIEISQAQVLPFFQVYDSSFEGRRLELFVPLVVRDEIVGAIFLGEKATGEAYTSYDKDIVCAMGQHIGVAIAQRNLMAEIERHADENRQLFDEMRSTYHDTVRAFAAAIDCKDKYTEGHSVRVGKFSEIIAAEAWLGSRGNRRGGRRRLSARRRQADRRAKDHQRRRIASTPRSRPS